MSSASPTQRTLAYCRKHGMRACVVEKYIAPGLHRKFGHRVDVWGFGDVLALDGEPGSLLIQATSADNIAHRVAKIRTECAEAARAWLAAGNRAQVWGWRATKQGGRKLWSVRVVSVTGEDLAPVEFVRPKGKRRRNATQLELGVATEATANTTGA
jgi:hypothetical protein